MEKSSSQEEIDNWIETTITRAVQTTEEDIRNHANTVLESQLVQKLVAKAHDLVREKPHLNLGVVLAACFDIVVFEKP